MQKGGQNENINDQQNKTKNSKYFRNNRTSSRIAPYIQYLLSSQDALDIADNEVQARPQRKFTLVGLYDSYLELSPEEELAEEAAGIGGDFTGVDGRIGKAAQMSGEAQLTDERRKFLRNTFRAAAEVASEEAMDLA